MSKYLGIALRIAFPDLDPMSDYEVRDDGDGPRLVGWNSIRPRPTPAQLETATLLAAREERKNAVALQEQITLMATFGSLTELHQTAALDPADPRLAKAKSTRVARTQEEQRIDRMLLPDLLAHRTPGETAREK